MAQGWVVSWLPPSNAIEHHRKHKNHAHKLKPKLELDVDDDDVTDTLDDQMDEHILPSVLSPPPAVAYYAVEHREGDTGPWIMSEQISQDNAYLIKELKTAVKYTIRVWAFSIFGVGSASATIEYKISNNSGSMKGSRAITAGVVGSVLFFVAAIILSVCAVKICNKRKQRKMEKAYMMVTCPVMDGMNGTHSHHGSPVTLKQIAQANKKDFHKAEYQV